MQSFPGRRGLVALAAAWGGAAVACASPSQPAPELGPFPSPFQIIAHRGASAYAPENTLPAYRLARDLGAVEVELDVQLTRDDRVVMFHDDTLDAKTAAHGPIRDHTLAELLQVDIGSWFDAAHPEVEKRWAGTRLDPLDDLFEEMGRSLVYHVELKDGEPELPARALAVVDLHGLRDRVVFTSFRFEQVERVRSLAPEIPTCLLIRRAEERPEPITVWIDRAVAAGFREVGVAADELDRDLVAHARERGIWIRAWRIRSEDDMQHAIEVGSNGMTLDWPERLIVRFLEHAGTAGAHRP